MRIIWDGRQGLFYGFIVRKLKTERPRKKRKTSEQLRTQKEGKKKKRFSLRQKKEEKLTEKKEESLEEKAGLSEKETKNKTEKKEVKKSK